MTRVVNSYLLVIILMIGKLMIIVNKIYMLHLVDKQILMVLLHK